MQQNFDNMRKVADAICEELQLLLAQMKARTRTPLPWLDFSYIFLRNNFWTLLHIGMFFLLSFSLNLIKIDLKGKE